MSSPRRFRRADRIVLHAQHHVCQLLGGLQSDRVLSTEHVLLYREHIAVSRLRLLVPSLQAETKRKVGGRQ
jgi:hypothetical protein